jgi:hypothetical protein
MAGAASSRDNTPSATSRFSSASPRSRATAYALGRDSRKPRPFDDSVYTADSGFNFRIGQILPVSVRGEAFEVLLKMLDL